MFALVKNRYRDEDSFEAVAARHPRIPRLVAIKTDVQRRGVSYTPRALAAVDPQVHQIYDFGVAKLPHSLMLRDATTVLTLPQPAERDPYLVDHVDGRFVLVDDGQVIEPVELWRRPAYYDKQTSSGRWMKDIMPARPSRLDLFAMSYCYFHTDDQGCKFCGLPAHYQDRRAANHLPRRAQTQDITECVAEAIKEPGRFTNVCLTGGSIVKGEDLFDLEVDTYIGLLQAVGAALDAPKFSSQLIGSAFTEKQLRRLYDETGLTNFTTDIEVLDERLFNWICPGKARWVGFGQWRERLIAAVDVFGRGHVGTGIVAGVETATPEGVRSEDEALDLTLSGAEDLARHGVVTVAQVWTPIPGSPFHDQKAPSLEYYLRLAQGLQDIRARHGLSVDFDNYRQCGNHPDTDLARLQ